MKEKERSKQKRRGKDRNRNNESQRRRQGDVYLTTLSALFPVTQVCVSVSSLHSHLFFSEKGENHFWSCKVVPESTARGWRNSFPVPPTPTL